MPNPKLLKRTETTSSDTRDLITTSPPPSNAVSPKDVVNARNFGFLPIPSRLRYEPGKPFSFGLPLNLFFGSINGLTVASLYYCQPLLVQMAKSFDLSEEQVTLIPTLTQAGYATGLVFISPLGDLVRRRELLLMLGCLVGIFNLGLALSPTGKIFAGISYLMGIVTVVPPVIISLTGDLAPPERRASAIAISVTGALIGILYARVVAGIVAEFVSWRIIYWISCGMQFTSVLTMWMVIPDYPSKNPHSTYSGILYTMARYAVTEPGLIQCYLISMISSAIFANFWVNLTFLLTGAPYSFSILQIGLFGLVGALGVLVTPLVGRFVDKLGNWTTIGISVVIGVVFQSIFTGAAGIHIAAVIIVCFGLDVSVQMNSVSNFSRIHDIEPSAGTLMTAVLIIANYFGQVMGTSAGTRVYLKYGWRANGALALGLHVPQLVFLIMRGPNVPRARWIGWRGEPKAPVPADAGPHEPQEQT